MDALDSACISLAPKLQHEGAPPKLACLDVTLQSGWIELATARLTARYIDTDSYATRLHMLSKHIVAFSNSSRVQWVAKWM